MPPEPESSAVDRPTGAVAGLLQEVFSSYSRRGGVRKTHPWFLFTSSGRSSYPIESGSIRSATSASRVYVRLPDGEHDLFEWTGAETGLYTQQFQRSVFDGQYVRFCRKNERPQIVGRGNRSVLLSGSYRCRPSRSEEYRADREDAEQTQGFAPDGDHPETPRTSPHPRRIDEENSRSQNVEHVTLRKVTGLQDDRATADDAATAPQHVELESGRGEQQQTRPLRPGHRPPTLPWTTPNPLSVRFPAPNRCVLPR